VDTDLSGAADTMTKVEPRPVEEKVPETNNAGAPTAGVPERDEILKNIDRHLVARQTASDRITIENTLTAFDFQRLLIEINETDASGAIVRSNLYTVTNLEAGTTKVLKITPPRADVKVEIQIVKAKSEDLTGGEMIIVGSRYSPG
jgi:hypothetical protein